MSSIVNKERIPYKIWNTVNKVWDQLFFITNANINRIYEFRCRNNYLELNKSI